MVSSGLEIRHQAVHNVGERRQDVNHFGIWVGLPDFLYHLNALDSL
jgi:hypothetical protein